MDDLEQLKLMLSQLKNKLETERPVNWSEFPDIGLYKDQVVSYMQRQFIDFNGSGQITSAMINNYIKDNLLPRADGKKYLRDHLAGLTEICLLKQVLSVNDTGFLMQRQLDGSKPEKFYTRFRQILDEALARTSEQIDPDRDVEELSDMALQLAVSSYCEKLAVERLLEIIRRVAAGEQKKPDKEQKKPDKEQKKPDKEQKKPDRKQTKE